MKVVVDRRRCMGMGACESLAPEHFEVHDDGQVMLLRESVADESRMDVEAAVEGCPTEALRLEERVVR